MVNNIYKKIIEDSPIAYLHIKFTENNRGEYVSLDIKDYNKSFENLLSLEFNIKINEIHKELDDPQEQKKWQAVYNKAKENKKYTVERFIEQTNQHFTIDVYYEENNEFHILMTKLNKHYLKLNSVLKNSPFLVWAKDKNGKYIDANQNYLDVLGKSYSDVIGKTDFDLLEKDTATLVKEEDDMVLSTNKVHSFEYTTNIPSSKKNYFEIKKWPYMNDYETSTLGIVGLCTNITKEVELKKELEATHQRFIDIANTTEEIIIIRDEKKALYINPAFEKIYGFKPDKLYEDITSWYDYWDSVEFEEEFITDFNYKKTDICHFKVSKEGQEDIYIWSKFVPILDKKGNVIKRVGILSDITEQKKLKQEIDKMKLDFFANLSHELRTPINLILSSLQVLYLKMYSLNPQSYEYFDKYLSIVNQNGKRLLKLVNNLIDTTKLDSGCFDYAPKNSDIVSCIENICLSTSSFVNTNNLNIIFDTNIEEKIVSFDQDNMERIILNLISNAIKFNKPNGSINVTITCEDDIKISIKDTGIGIPEDKLDSIFGRFEQVNSHAKREKEGSGIGLALVKSLVEIHNGTISVNSKLGEGSEFIITLPDVLLEEGNPSIDEFSMFDNTFVNRMDIEFADIYM